jgi:CxxC motif-containing protein
VTTEKEITCIVCPIGCKILVSATGTRVDVVKGQKCNKGIEYARNEVFDPRRMLTTSVLVRQGEWPLVSVKSTQPVPKEKLFAVLRVLRKTSVQAPLHCGQIILKNAADTGIDIIATKTIKKMKTTQRNTP